MQRAAMTELEQLQSQAQLYGFMIAAAPARPARQVQYLLSRPQTGGTILYRGSLQQVRAHLKQLQFARDCFLCP